MSGGIIRSTVRTLSTVYRTQGSAGVLKNVFWELPVFYVRMAAIATTLKASAMFGKSREAVEDQKTPVATVEEQVLPKKPTVQSTVSGKEAWSTFRKALDSGA